MVARRPDVMVYESDVLTEAITLAGPIEVDLWVSTTGTDADYVVKLIDVFPDDLEDYPENDKDVPMAGYQMMVRGDVLRALSTIDLALWDLIGKAKEEPVYRLLGGPCQERIRAYAAMLGFSTEPDLAAEQFRELCKTFDLELNVLDDATLHVEEFRIISLVSGLDLIAEFEKKARGKR